MFLSLVYYQGLFFGVTIFYAISNANICAIHKLKELEALSSTDEMFFHDDERQSGNIVCYQRVQKFKFDEFRRAQLEKALQFPRLKSRVVKYLGMLFFE
jgi:hypothetical protein